MIPTFKPKKIAIIAAHSTGKTTLAKALAKELKIPLAKNDFARELSREKFGGKRLEQLNDWEFCQLEFLHYAKKIESTLKRRHFIADGGFILGPIYLGLMNPRLTAEKSYQAFLNLCLEQTKNIYTHIIYLPPEIGLEDDNYRPLDKKLRQRVDRLLVRLLDKNKISYFTASGSVAARLKQTIKHIKSAK